MEETLSSKERYERSIKGKYKGIREEAARLRGKLDEVKRLKESLLTQQQEAIQQQKVLEQEAQEEERQKSNEKQLKKYFYYDEFNHYRLEQGEGYYTGDMEIRPVPNYSEYGHEATPNPSWLPSGKGVFVDFDRVVLEGDYKKGSFQRGRVLHRSTEQLWEGRVSDHRMDGAGHLTSTTSYTQKKKKPALPPALMYSAAASTKSSPVTVIEDEETDDEKEEFETITVVNEDDIIANKGIVLCYRKGKNFGIKTFISILMLHHLTIKLDLIVGRQIEFENGGVVGAYGNGLRNVRAAIVRHYDGWRYWLRFEDNVWPKDRLVSCEHLWYN